jgi:SAM-dependent methyltransferase
MYDRNRNDVRPKLRVNVGCGATPTPGWTNFDNSLTVVLAKLPFAPAFLGPTRSAFVAEVRRGSVRRAQATLLPIADGSAEVLYSSHMLEHLARSNARRFLAEAKRVLSPRGVLRLAVPDLRIQVERYLRVGDADAFVDGTRLAADHSTTALARLRLFVAGVREHVWMYDAQSLTRLVASVGFSDVAVVPPGETRISDAAPLNLREREDESLYVEGTNP